MSFDPEDLEQLAALECPDCGPLVEDGEPTLLSWDKAGLEQALVGNACPECGAELEPTLDAALDRLKFLVELRPDLAPEVARLTAEALGGEA